MTKIAYIVPFVLLIHALYTVLSGRMQLHDPGGSYSSFIGIPAYLAAAAEIVAAWLIYDVMNFVAENGYDPQGYRHLATKKRKIAAVAVLILFTAASLSDIFVSLH